MIIDAMIGLGTARGMTHAQPFDARGTSPRCPRSHNAAIRDVWNSGPSHVDARSRPTLQRRVVVPNPQHLLLTLFFETSMYEEKCRL